MAGLYAYRVTYINDDDMSVIQKTGIAAGVSIVAIFNNIYTEYKNIEYVEIDHITDGLYEIDEDTHSAITNP